MKNIKHQIKKQLEELYTEEDNTLCFDCGNKSAFWASISNGIYLCLDCSGEHRSYGLNISFIRSLTMDIWTQEQVNIMKVGGNKRLKDFLTKYEIPENLDKKDIYCSNIMNYYRKLLKTESIGQYMMEPLPPKKEFWKPFKNDINFDIDIYNNSIKEKKTKTTEIVINNDQYRKARNNSELIINNDDDKKENNNLIQNSTRTNIISVSSDQNEERFGAVGSEGNPNNNSFLSTVSTYATTDFDYFDTVKEVFYTMREAGNNPQSAQRINNYELSGKVFSLGTKSIGGLGYIGGVLILKGVQILRSDTVKNIFSSVGRGLWYLKEKLIGSNSQTNDTNTNNINFENGEEESYNFLENHDYNV